MAEIDLIETLSGTLWMRDRSQRAVYILSSSAQSVTESPPVRRGGQETLSFLPHGRFEMSGPGSDDRSRVLQGHWSAAGTQTCRLVSDDGLIVVDAILEADGRLRIDPQQIR